MALEGTFGQVLAAFAVGVAARVVIVFQPGLGIILGLGFQLQARFLEIVVAAGDLAGAGFHAYAEVLDHRVVGYQAGVLLVGKRCEAREHGLVVAEGQQVAIAAVLEVVVDAFLFAQTLDEVQVALVVLHAVVALGVDRAELELIGVGLDAVLFEHLADDLLHRQVLEDALVGAVCQVGQLWYQGQAVAGDALAGFTLGDAVDQAVGAGVVLLEGEEGGLGKPGFQIVA